MHTYICTYIHTDIHTRRSEGANAPSSLETIETIEIAAMQAADSRAKARSDAATQRLKPAATQRLSDTAAAVFPESGVPDVDFLTKLYDFPTPDPRHIFHNPKSKTLNPKWKFPLRRDM